MAKFKIYGNRNKSETGLERNNRLIAREIAREGFVLLENDGVLPLKAQKIALYGGGARLTIKGGSGSGDVRERYSVNIEDGLKNNGFEIVGDSWLKRFSETYEKEKKEYVERVESEIKDYPVWKVMDMFKKIGESKLAYPVGDLINDDDLSNETDTCIYVIARQAGEGDDRKLEKGDYYLSDLEIENIKKCRNHYEKVIVIINCGSSLEINVLNEIGVNATLFYGQAGQEGGNALGEILSGKYSPSGKLTDTWAYQYQDYPILDIPHDELLDENYQEGIYVGYRYFDSKGIKPLYPFGYGLSYSEFKTINKGIEVDGSKVVIDVEVNNIGNYKAKEVVFAFLFKPNDKYYGEVKSLVAFNKTNELDLKGKEVIKLSFDVTDFATYDEKNHYFILEKGEYGLAIGKNVNDYEMIGVLNISDDLITEKNKNCCSKVKEFEDYQFENEKPNYDGLNRYEIKGETIINDYEYQLPKVSDKVNQYLENLTDEELAMFAMGGGYFSKQYIKVLGACGNTTSLLLKKGIPNIIMSDGPAGINIMQEAAYTKGGSTRYIDHIPEEWNWGWLKKVMPKIKFLIAGKNDIPCYQYCTAFPNATTMAQTFNVELIERAGEGVGKEMLDMGITLWLAPALNIHRDPLCGRNFEYYSEDPIVSGLMAAAITRGVQKNKGVGVTLKHFACNNRENQRTKVSSNLSERALREIYLKGFKIALRENPMAIMSSYNRINGIYAPNNKELLIDILRCEWKYEGLVMSDWDAVDQCSYLEAVKCGNNMIMPGTKETYRQLVEGLKNKLLSRDEIKVSALYALKMIFEAKTTNDFLNNK